MHFLSREYIPGEAAGIPAGSTGNVLILQDDASKCEARFYQVESPNKGVEVFLKWHVPPSPQAALCLQYFKNDVAKLLKSIDEQSA